MFYAVRYDGSKLGVLDRDDNTVEHYTLDEIKHFVKDLGIEICGVVLSEDTNPMFTLNGLSINLFYEQAVVVDRFRVVLLKSGDRWGRTFSKMINKPTVAFFDVVTNLSLQEYPSGQYIASYDADTILKHNPSYGLILNTEVEDWKVSPEGMKDVIKWLKYQLGK